MPNHDAIYQLAKVYVTVVGSSYLLLGLMGFSASGQQDGNILGLLIFMLVWMFTSFPVDLGPAVMHGGNILAGFFAGQLPALWCLCIAGNAFLMAHSRFRRNKALLYFSAGIPILLAIIEMYSAFGTFHTAFGVLSIFNAMLFTIAVRVLHQYTDPKAIESAGLTSRSHLPY